MMSSLMSVPPRTTNDETTWVCLLAVAVFLDNVALYTIVVFVYIYTYMYVYKLMSCAQMKIASVFRVVFALYKYIMMDNIHNIII